MNELEEFARRELELKGTMTFGEWLRHIKSSHEELCRLVLATPKQEKPIRVEVLDRSAGCGVQTSTYEIPSDCNRVLVDAQRIQGKVWGFRRNNDDPIRDEQVIAVLVSRHTGALLG